MNDFIIGRRLFTDGANRDVLQADDGRQYVVGDDGTPAYGAWVLDDDADEPLIVPAPTT